MKQAAVLQANPAAVRRNKVKTFFSKPHNVILLLMGIVLTITTVAPIIAIVQDTFKIHPGTIDAYLAGTSQGYTLVNYTDLFTSPLAKANLWTPLLNTVLLSVGSCIVAILFGGVFAFLITRTNLSCRKYLSSIFIFPYIMPQWTLAVVWQNLFNSNAVTGTSNGLLTSLFNVQMPLWWCKGLFPSLIVLGMHYAPFAYILIGGIFRNMDANLEEAATILDTPKWKTMFRITLPMVKPAILSTILLVFGSSMGSYPVPHYLGLATLSTKYVSMNSKYTGEASILAIIMMIFGVAIMMLNQLSLTSRKNYTTVTGKSGQISKINLGKSGKYIIAVILVILTFFTSIFPIVSFAFETFLPNPGDYSFLYTGDTSNLTAKWWVTSENVTENGMYGQKGILHNETIWHAFRGTIFVSVCCALLAGTIGTGNIVGVATAIVSGGPGAIFWMWVMALLGMMTSFAENVLGVYYRRKNEKGEWSGGAMYYLTDGLGAKPGCKAVGRVLAVLFACFCILASFGIGNMSQINSIAGNMNAAFHLPYLATGLALMVVTALIVIGGLKRVAAVTEKLVPLMALFYVAGALIIVVMHAGNIPAALAAIFKGAFNLNAAGGGALGYGISQTITWGFKRGAFSNEAGLGSAVMVNSASNVKEPVHQGMWGVFEVFADTIVVCTLTALVILTTGVVDLQSGAVLVGVQDNALVGQAFTAAFGSFGPKFIAISILLFAYSTTLGWSHYGTKAVEYLFGTTGSRIYKVVFVCMTVVGATMKLGLAWDLSDTFNGLMMIPNLIGVLALSGTVVDITRNYFARRVRGEDIEPMWSAFEEYQKEEEAEAAAEKAELEKAANK